MSRANSRSARSRSRPKLDRVTQILLVAFLSAACITSILAFFWARSFFSSFTLFSLPGAPQAVSGQKGSSAGNGSGSLVNVPTPSGPLQGETDPTPVPWDGTSRVTMLFMGLDYRDWSEGTDVPRTDSMILLSVDPLTKTAGVLSIPRDLWVNIPGIGNNKINTAYRWGEIYKTPGGGPALAMKTVEETLGVPVDYYAMIDFNSFVKFIDELGGLDMKIREEITIDPIGPGNTRTLEPGTQTLTGAEVLAYARNRYTANDDFDRSRRQQEVIMAIRKQILQFNMLPTLIAKSPVLYQELSSGIRTNLTLDQVSKLARLAAKIDERNIKKGVIGPPNQVIISTNPEDGQSILIPVPDQIRILRDQVFVSTTTVTVPSDSPSTSPSTEPAVPEATQVTDLAKAIKTENATILIKNGTSTPGLASKASEILKSAGIKVIGEENADHKYSQTTIQEYFTVPKVSTINLIIDKLKLKNYVLLGSTSDQPPADIVIILGADWARQQK
jgi:polyisoprenyl-teichoic acid--peptidoglycan teichoic acid transferase